jgi:hypothetical protein
MHAYKVHVYEGFCEDLARLFQRQLGFQRPHTWVSVSSHMGFSHYRSVPRPLYRTLHGMLRYQCSSALFRSNPAYQCNKRPTKVSLRTFLYFQSPFLFPTAYLDNDAPTLSAMLLLALSCRLGNSTHRSPGHGRSCSRGFAGSVE